MKKHLLPPGFLIIVELGAEWPNLPTSVPPSSRSVLAQDDAESPAAFAWRVAERVTGFSARGGSLGGVIIACNERLDEPAHGARAELARAAANGLARARGGSLLLSATDRNQGRSRAVFAALHRKLCDEWQAAAVDAKLRFGDEPVLLEFEDPVAHSGSRPHRTGHSPRSLA
jgi:hypothetical protein